MEPKIEERNLSNAFNNNNQIPESNNNENENSNKKTPEKRHRRGKDVLEGRQYICNFCKKAYLSKPALNSHLNTKHKDELKKNNIPQKKRGRPRKSPITNGDNNEYEKNKFIPFFTENLRKKIIIENDNNIENSIDFKKVCFNVYDEIKEFLDKKYEKIEDHPIFNYVLNNITNTEYNFVDTIADNIICKYLNVFYKETNENYFKFMIKFLILFRECINEKEKNPNDNNIEFTTYSNTENFPEKCNYFFTDYLESKNYCKFTENEKDELIEIIQHFCFWLYQNNYTKSKLTLAS